MVAINLFEMGESFKFYYWHFCCLGNSLCRPDPFLQKERRFRVCKYKKSARGLAPIWAILDLNQ